MTDMRRPFGQTSSGEPVELLTISNQSIKCEIITYGAAVRALYVNDKNNKPIDIVLGYDNISDYCTQTVYFGAVVGRHANRIAGGKFSINGKEYAVSVNQQPNHLHGGFSGFSHKVWSVEEHTAQKLVLSLFSPDGEEGFPGNLELKVTYELKGSSLSIRYEAVSDKDTVCNITNHSYFNLGGHNSGDVLSHKLTIFADSFTPANSVGIPVGSIEKVFDTPFDFTDEKTIGNDIAADYLQLSQFRGYDHNFVINGKAGSLRPAAKVCCEQNGITMSVSTTTPGMHLYTANYVLEGHPGKAGAVYAPRHGVCFETQFFPDSINHPEFAPAILKAGEKFDHETVFSF